MYIYIIKYLNYISVKSEIEKILSSRNFKLLSARCISNVKCKLFFYTLKSAQ